MTRRIAHKRTDKPDVDDRRLALDALEAGVQAAFIHGSPEIGGELIKWAKLNGYLWIRIAIDEGDNPNRPPRILNTIRKPEDIPALVDAINKLAEWPDEFMSLLRINYRVRVGDEVITQKDGMNLGVVIKRQNRGGNKPRAGLPSIAKQEEYNYIATSYYESGKSVDQFALDMKISRGKVYNAINYSKKKKRPR